MEAKALTPRDLFDGKVSYEVPPFQRPYVWTEEDQWQPLWDDIARVAEADRPRGQSARFAIQSLEPEPPLQRAGQRPSRLRQEPRGLKTGRAPEYDREGYRLVVRLPRRRSHSRYHHKKVLSSTDPHSAVTCA